MVQGAGDDDDIPVNVEYQIQFPIETHDVGNNFSGNTFTAPVTGIYILSANISAHNLDAEASNYQFRIVTSIRNYTQHRDPTGFDEAFNANYNFDLTVIAPMSAGDTASVSLWQGGGTQQTDINGVTFMGALLH